MGRFASTTNQRGPTVSHITVQQLKELRQRTGAGMLDCRQALEQAEGNMEQAVELIRRQAAAEAAKRAARLTGEGQVVSYIHHDAKVGALVEVNCETDFVARTEDFRALVRYVAEQVAATPPDALETEGSLLQPPWIRDASRTIGDLVSETSARVGENVRVRRFARFRISDVGERGSARGERGEGRTTGTAPLPPPPASRLPLASRIPALYRSTQCLTTRPD